MSMKKSILMVVIVIVLVTVFQLTTSGGNAMLIDMSDTSISFSGIDDFKHELAYADIESVAIEDVSDWTVWGGHEFGHFRIGDISNSEGHQYTLFVTTQCSNAVIATLTDGSRMVFNYNNNSDTEAIYNMLLENIR